MRANIKATVTHCVIGGEKMKINNIIYDNLRAEMARNKLTICHLAKTLDSNRDTLSRKLSGKSPLYLDEAIQIQKTFFPYMNIDTLFISSKEDSN